MNDLLDILPADNRKWHQPQCSICGQFISTADLEDESKTIFEHIPEWEFHAEENYYTHIRCEAIEEMKGMFRVTR